LDKEQEIRRLEAELAESRGAFSSLQQVRSKEMQSVALVCNALTARLKSLNVNFRGDDGEK
jgi:hypothetical protein